MVCKLVSVMLYIFEGMFGSMCNIVFVMFCGCKYIIFLRMSIVLYFLSSLILIVVFFVDRGGDVWLRMNVLSLFNEIVFFVVFMFLSVFSICMILCDFNKLFKMFLFFSSFGVAFSVASFFVVVALLFLFLILFVFFLVFWLLLLLFFFYVVLFVDVSVCLIYVRVVRAAFVAFVRVVLCVLFVCLIFVYVVSVVVCVFGVLFCVVSVFDVCVIVVVFVNMCVVWCEGVIFVLIGINDFDWMCCFYGVCGVVSVWVCECGCVMIDDCFCVWMCVCGGVIVCGGVWCVNEWCVGWFGDCLVDRDARARRTNKVLNFLYDVKCDDVMEKGGNKLGKICSVWCVWVWGVRGGMGRCEDAKTGLTVDAFDGGGEKEIICGGDGGGGGI